MCPSSSAELPIRTALQKAGHCGNANTAATRPATRLGSASGGARHIGDNPRRPRGGISCALDRLADDEVFSTDAATPDLCALSLHDALPIGAAAVSGGGHKPQD